MVRDGTGWDIREDPAVYRETIHGKGIEIMGQDRTGRFGSEEERVKMMIINRKKR